MPSPLPRVEFQEGQMRQGAHSVRRKDPVSTLVPTSTRCFRLLMQSRSLASFEGMSADLLYTDQNSCTDDQPVRKSTG